MQQFTSSRFFYFIFFFVLAISCLGLFITIMEVDAAQYASMSLEMLLNQSFFKISDLAQPYLDKPPLLFWLSSISIAIFGNTTWAYKLPSFVIAWSSVYALFRLTFIFYSQHTAKIASLIYASSMAFVLFTNDIRTDTLMISFVIFAVWQGISYLVDTSYKHLVLFSIFTALAMLAKGPLGIVIPLLILCSHILFTKKWSLIVDFKIGLMPIIILLLLSPMMYGLYQQWGWQGLRFYFWEQSFGRITGENVWKNDAGYFYLFQNFLWAFLPFTIYFFLALIHYVRHFRSQKEFVSFFGFFFPLLALSLSHYKLPHYIYVVIPFTSILCAQFITSNAFKSKKLQLGVIPIQIIIIAAYIILSFLLLYCFSASVYWYIFFILSFISFAIFYIQKKSFFYVNLFGLNLTCFLILALLLNTYAYPNLLQYQSSSEAAKYILNQKLDYSNIYTYKAHGRAFHYYLGHIASSDISGGLNNHKEVLVYTSLNGKKELENIYNCRVIKHFEHFNVTRLSILFLNPKTRNKTLKFYYLLLVSTKRSTI